MKLKKIPWISLIPAVADAARELFNRGAPEEQSSSVGARSGVTAQISEIMQRLELLEASQIDRAALLKRVSRLAIQSSVAIWLSVVAFVISCVVLLVVLIR